MGQALHFCILVSPSLKGAGDNDLPVKGVVDLEFKVGKTKITMKRVVVVGIPLNVISTYALSETGWKTVLEFAFKAQEWCEGFWTSTDAL